MGGWEGSGEGGLIELFLNGIEQFSSVIAIKYLRDRTELLCLITLQFINLISNGRHF